MFALARLVHARAGPPLSDALLDSLVADTARTMQVPLVRTVPVRVSYELAEVRDGVVILYRDVYGYAGVRVPDARASVMRALAEHDVDTTAVDASRLRAFTRAPRRPTARVPLDSLLAVRVEARGK